MLPVKEVKPLLLHENRHIRKAAVRYLGGMRFEDDELLPLHLQSYRQYEKDGYRYVLSNCSHFSINDESLKEVMEELALTTDEIVVEHLNRIILAAPISLQLSHKSLILDTPKLLPETIAAIEQRHEFACWSAEKLWDELQKFAERSIDKYYTNEIDLTYAESLIAALGQYDEPNSIVICNMIEDVDGCDHWLPIFLIDLAGERRLEESIPLLVDKYQIDTDYMLERVTEALDKINHPNAVRHIKEAFPTASWNFKTYASSVLGDIKHEESEKALLELLKIEKDSTIRTMLCDQLCQLFSARGAEIVLQEIRNGYDPSFDCLEDSLLPVADVLGIDIPEADDWRVEIEKNDYQLIQSLDEMKEELMSIRENSLPHYDLPGTETVLTATSRERIIAPRVGRNDPCPCGSGKKFKKCCIRKPR